MFAKPLSLKAYSELPERFYPSGDATGAHGGEKHETESAGSVEFVWRTGR